MDHQEDTEVEHHHQMGSREDHPAVGVGLVEVVDTSAISTDHPAEEGVDSVVKIAIISECVIERLVKVERGKYRFKYVDQHSKCSLSWHRLVCDTGIIYGRWVW